VSSEHGGVLAARDTACSGFQTVSRTNVRKQSKDDWQFTRFEEKTYINRTQYVSPYAPGHVNPGICPDQVLIYDASNFFSRNRY
jgi:hypothetical protein